jgi:hypothetical protein
MGAIMSIWSALFSTNPAAAVGQAAGSVVKDTLGGIGTLAKDIRTAITGKDPEKQAEIDLKLQELEAQALKGQMDITLAEAQSSSVFVSGARPALIWICDLAIFFYFIPQYCIASYMWASAYIKTGAIVPFPIAEPKGLIELVVVLLGAATLRSIDKNNQVASK